jgi:hypothetical protein
MAEMMPGWMTNDKMIALYGDVFDDEFESYGVAPHTHNWEQVAAGGPLTTTPLTIGLNEHGHYVTDVYVFVPDPDAGGACGTFYYKREAVAGWRDS